MNGPAHYREAERLLADVADMDPGFQQINAPRVLAEAQVHATLALAAAAAVANGRNLASVQRWMDVAS